MGRGRKRLGLGKDIPLEVAKLEVFLAKTYMKPGMKKARDQAFDRRGTLLSQVGSGHTVFPAEVFRLNALAQDLRLLHKVIASHKEKLRSRTSSLRAYYDKRDAYNSARRKDGRQQDQKAFRRACQKVSRLFQQRRSLLSRAAVKVFEQEPIRKLRRHLRRRYEKAIRYFTKPGSMSRVAQEIVGCSLRELRAHLESQFQPGMSWANYGFEGWHIDHRVPISSFDLTDPEQRQKAFHFSNLQPLWASVNLAKGRRV